MGGSPRRRSRSSIGARASPSTCANPVRGRHTTDPVHMPLAHQRHREWTPARLIAWGRTIGPQTAALVQAILADRPPPPPGVCLVPPTLRISFGELEEAASLVRVFEVDSVVRQRRRAPRSQRRPHDAHPSARVRYELWLQAWPVVNHLGSWMSHANSASADVATASRPKEEGDHCDARSCGPGVWAPISPPRRPGRYRLRPVAIPRAAGPRRGSRAGARSAAREARGPVRPARLSYRTPAVSTVPCSRHAQTPP